MHGYIAAGGGGAEDTPSIRAGNGVSRREAAVAIATLAAAAALGGCGDDDEGGAPAATDAELKPPTKPAAADCATETLATRAKPDDIVPRPGRYRYETTGTRRVLGSEGSTSRLPRETETIVTPVLEAGSLRCFRVQRRYNRQLGDTGTFVVRGGDLWLTHAASVAGGQLLDLRPNPPIRSVPGDAPAWRGTFRGPTSGRYAGEVLGRREIRGEPAIGLRLEIVSRGELEGTERSTRWISLERNLVLSETVLQQRKFGLDVAELRFESRLVE